MRQCLPALLASALVCSVAKADTPPSMITSAMKVGRITFVEIQPARGGTCRIRNPWGEAQQVRVWRDGKEKELLTGALFLIETTAGEDLVLMPSGEDPEKFKLRLPEN